MADTEPPTKPHQWPREWARSETFWKDVASRTIAGTIVVALTYAGAVLFGYLQQPEFVGNLGTAFAGITGVVFAGLIVVAVFGYFRRPRTPGERGLWLLFVLVGLVGLVVSAAEVANYYGLWP